MGESSQASSSYPEAEFLDDDISKIVHRLLEEYHIPGMSVAVVNEGKISAEGFGIARYPDVAATAETLYFTGSTTKAMLAAATGILMQDKGNLEEESNALLQNLQKNKWKTTISSILPSDFQLEDDYATSNMTIEDSLSHRSGLASADLIYGNWMGQDPKGVVRALRYLGPLNKLFRTAYQYNNLMFSVVGDLLKTITGLEAGAILKRLLWDPLGMSSTFWKLDEIPESQRQSLARGYYWVNQSSTSSKSNGYYVTEPYIDFAGIAAAGATISSVNDYGKWIKELLRVAAKDPKSSAGTSVLTPELFSELTTPRIMTPALLGGEQNSQINLSAYGLGWMIQPPLEGIDHPIVRHSGGLNGFTTQLFLLPNADFGCVTVCNAIWGRIVGEIICIELIARKLGLSDQVKSKLIDLVRAKVPTIASEKASGPIETERDNKPSNLAKVPPQAGPDIKVKKFLERVVGDYSHPAYGPFRVSQYEESESDRVVYSAWLARSECDERNQRRSRQPCILVAPIGHRTWKFRILLHARDEFGESLHTFPLAPEIADGSELIDLFFDAEFMDGHGNLEDDASEGFLTGVEDLGENVKDVDLRRETVWSSQLVCELGAAFKFEHGKDATIKLGIRIAEQFDGTVGHKNVGWEKDMVWLTKKQ